MLKVFTVRQSVNLPVNKKVLFKGRQEYNSMVVIGSM